MSRRRCAELIGEKTPLQISEYGIPEPPEQGLVVKTRYSGICHSDIHVQDGEISLEDDKPIRFINNPNFKYPIVLGHEISGFVYSLGTELQDGRCDLNVGDKVIVFPWVGCRSADCEFCTDGNSPFCIKPSGNIGIVTQGGYSSHVSLPNRVSVMKIPDVIPMDVACTLPCGALTSYNALLTAKPIIEKFTKLTGRASALLIGAGGLGIWCLQLARVLLPKTTLLIVADVSEDRLATAVAHGADKTVLWDSSDESELLSRTRSAGYDDRIQVAIDFVNSSQTSARAFTCLQSCGALLLVGLYGGRFNAPLPVMALTGKQIIGVNIGTSTMLRELVDLVARTEILPPPIEQVKLEGVNDALDRLRKGKVKGRVIIAFD